MKICATLSLIMSLPLLLAACSEPPQQESRSTFDPGPYCQAECAAGYRWALDKELSSKVKCRGDSEFTRGCYKAVEFAHPFAKE
jgi:hypothetical protein